MSDVRFILCDYCNTEGRIYYRVDPRPRDNTTERDGGECPVCHGECVVEVAVEPITIEDFESGEKG